MRPITLLLLFISPAFAQDHHPRGDGLALGFEFSETAQDFGLGLQLTSPWFAGGAVAIRAAGVASFYTRGIDKEAELLDFVPYTTARLGAVAGFWPARNIRSYAEGGVLFVKPHKDFASEIAFGGYGTVGVDFFVNESGFIYFLEVSGVGSGAAADEVLGEPSYQNGFRTAGGVRYAF